MPRHIFHILARNSTLDLNNPLQYIAGTRGYHLGLLENRCSPGPEKVEKAKDRPGQV